MSDTNTQSITQTRSRTKRSRTDNTNENPTIPSAGVEAHPSSDPKPSERPAKRTKASPPARAPAQKASAKHAAKAAPRRRDRQAERARERQSGSSGATIGVGLDNQTGASTTNQGSSPGADPSNTRFKLSLSSKGLKITAVLPGHSDSSDSGSSAPVLGSSEEPAAIERVEFITPHAGNGNALAMLAGVAARMPPISNSPVALALLAGVAALMPPTPILPDARATTAEQTTIPPSPVETTIPPSSIRTGVSPSPVLTSISPSPVQKRQQCPCEARLSDSKAQAPVFGTLLSAREQRELLVEARQFPLPRLGSPIRERPYWALYEPRLHTSNARGA